MEILLLLILIIDVFKSLIKLKNNLKSNIYIYIYKHSSLNILLSKNNYQFSFKK